DDEANRNESDQAFGFEGFEEGAILLQGVPGHEPLASSVFEFPGHFVRSVDVVNFEFENRYQIAQSEETLRVGEPAKGPTRVVIVKARAEYADYAEAVVLGHHPKGSKFAL